MAKKGFWEWLFDDECYTELTAVQNADGSSAFRIVCDTRSGGRGNVNQIQFPLKNYKLLENKR